MAKGGFNANFSKLADEIRKQKDDAVKSSSIALKENVIDLDLIVPNPKNQESIDFEDIKRFAFDEIKPVGELVHNIAVRPIDNGKYMIISGERRWRAFNVLWEVEKDPKWSKIPVKVMHIENDVDDEIALLMANYGQRKYSEFDKARQAKRLIQLYQITGKSIPESIEMVAKNLNLSSSQIERYVEFSEKADISIQEAVREDKLAMSTAVMLSKADAETQQAIADLVNMGVQITREDAKRIIDQYKNKKRDVSKKEENSQGKKYNQNMDINSFNKGISKNLKKLDTTLIRLSEVLTDAKDFDIDSGNKKYLQELKAKLVVLLSELDKK